MRSASGLSVRGVLLSVLYCVSKHGQRIIQPNRLDKNIMKLTFDSLATSVEVLCFYCS